MKPLSDNARTAVGYICIALVFISMYIGGAWVLSPQEFTFKIEMDNNTRDAMQSINYSSIESASNNQNKCFERTIRWDRMWDVKENIIVSGSFYNTFETDCRKFNQDMINNPHYVNYTEGEKE